jgi:hypothetical protein
MMTTVTPSIADNPLDELESMAKLLAWHQRKYGWDFVREWLVDIANEPVPTELWKIKTSEQPTITTREFLMETAADLRSVGHRRLAKLTEQAAAKRPRKVDLCPYEPGSTNAKAWLWMARQKASLCPFCGGDRMIPELICDNGQTCRERWQNEIARTPRPRPA